MAAMTRLDDDDLKAIGEEVVRTTLSGIPLEDLVVSTGPDHDGDPAIFVRIDMPSGAAIIPARRLADARVALVKALAGSGDERLIYLSVAWPRDDAPPNSDVPP